MLTVWETIPFRDTFRAFRGRAYRRGALAAADLFLAATERARRLPAARGRRRGADRGLAPGRRHRAVPRRARGAARRAPDRLARPARLGEGPLGRPPRAARCARSSEPARLLIVGSGPERERLRRYAGDLGARRPGRDPRACRYAEMPAVVRARAACVVLGEPADPALGGAVRDGARRGDGGRRADRRERERRDPRGARRARGALRARRLGRARAAARPGRCAARRASASSTTPSSCAATRSRPRPSASAPPTRGCSRDATRAAASTARPREPARRRRASGASMSVLVVAGGSADREVLAGAGFENVTISNLDDAARTARARAVRVAVRGRREPHPRRRLRSTSRIVSAGLAPLPLAAPRAARALPRRRVAAIALESRDSALMRLATRLGAVDEYELGARSRPTASRAGGVANTSTPNFVYRWTEREVEKTIASFAPHARHRIRYFREFELPDVLVDTTARGPARDRAPRCCGRRSASSRRSCRARRTCSRSRSRSRGSPRDLQPWLRLAGDASSPTSERSAQRYTDRAVDLLVPAGGRLPR